MGCYKLDSVTPDKKSIALKTHQKHDMWPQAAYRGKELNIFNNRISINSIVFGTGFLPNTTGLYIMSLHNQQSNCFQKVTHKKQRALN